MKAAVLLLVLAQASHGDDPIEVERPLEDPVPKEEGVEGEVLGDARYQFCHDERYPLREDERPWCDLVGEDNARCPKFSLACKAGVEAEIEEKERDLFKRRTPGEAEEARRAKQEQKKIQVPTALSGLAQILFFLLIAAGLAALVWIAFRDRVSARDPEAPDAPPPDEGDAPDDEPGRIVLTDVERLLAEARRAAEAGRYEQAIDLAYAAALRRLDGDGLIDMHHSRTNGDYVRSLRGQPDLAAHMRDIVRDVERVQFGASAATRPMFESVLSRVMPVATRVAAVALLLFGMACEPSDGGEEVVGGGFSPSGTRAVVEVLQREGMAAGYRLERLSKVGETTAVLLVLPGGGPEDGDWTGVKQWVDEGGLLVLAGEAPDDPELAIAWGAGSTQTILTPSEGWAWDLEGLTLRVPAGPTLEPTIGGEAAVVTMVRGPVVFGPGAEIPEVGSPYALEQSRGKGLVVALADAELFLNVSLAVGDNAEAAIFILEPLAAPGKVEVCTMLTGAGAETPMESIHRAKLTPFVLQLLAMLALWMLHRGVAFGRPRDPETHRRRAFADHVRALGMQYARARAAGRAAGAYAHWAIEQLRERLPRGRYRDLDEVATEAAARAGAPPDEVVSLLRAAQITSDTEGPPSTARAPGLTGQVPFANEGERLEIVRRLARLLEATGHGRRR
jgi:hypothetical protein